MDARKRKEDAREIENKRKRVNESQTMVERKRMLNQYVPKIYRFLSPINTFPTYKCGSGRERERGGL